MRCTWLKFPKTYGPLGCRSYRPHDRNKAPHDAFPYGIWRRSLPHRPWQRQRRLYRRGACGVSALTTRRRYVLFVATLLLATLACSGGSPAKIAPTQWVEWSDQEIGFGFNHPSDWTLEKHENLVSVTDAAGTAQISIGWRDLTAGETVARLTDRLVAITMSDLADPTVVPIRQEDGDTVELALTGVDNEGVRWIHHFVVSSGGNRALVVQTIAREDVVEAAQPVFESVLTSLATIEE